MVAVFVVGVVVVVESYSLLIRIIGDAVVSLK